MGTGRTVAGAIFGAMIAVTGAARAQERAPIDRPDLEARPTPPSSASSSAPSIPPGYARIIFASAGARQSMTLRFRNEDIAPVSGSMYEWHSSSRSCLLPCEFVLRPGTYTATTWGPDVASITREVTALGMDERVTLPAPAIGPWAASVAAQVLGGASMLAGILMVVVGYEEDHPICFAACDRSAGDGLITTGVVLLGVGLVVAVVGLSARGLIEGHPRHQRLLESSEASRAEY